MSNFISPITVYDPKLGPRVLTWAEYCAIKGLDPKTGKALPKGVVSSVVSKRKAK